MLCVLYVPKSISHFQAFSEAKIGKVTKYLRKKRLLEPFHVENNTF